MKRALKDAAGILQKYRTHGTASSGVPLPPLQYRMGGEHFRSDDAFVAAAVADVKRLASLAGLDRGSRLLDWGCGAGRLAVGIAEQFGSIADYHGVDVQRPLIEWAQRHIGRRQGFRFTHVDLANARYNPAGEQRRVMPGSAGEYNVFYAYSVFSHMLGDDSLPYLQELARVLSPGGVGFFTAFVEDGVERETENPSDYGPMRWNGNLHCVRYDRTYFDGLVEVAGLKIIGFEHGTETDGQSLYRVTSV